MLWRRIDATEYLIRTSTRGAQTSMGPRSPTTQAIHDSQCRPPSMRAASRSMSSAAARADRDPRKRGKDGLQADLVEQLVRTHLPHLGERSEARR